MENNLAFIPIYLNTEIVKSLYTIALKIFEESKSKSCKNQESFKICTPLSEICTPLEGKYVQGTMEIHFLKEFSSGKTEIEISKNVVEFIQVKEILKSNGLLKNILSKEDMRAIKKNDYIEFPCSISKNPAMQYVEELVDNMRANVAINKEFSKENLKYIKEELQEHKERRCIDYLCKDNVGSGMSIVLPIECRYIIGNEDYLDSDYCYVLGKVIKVSGEEAEEEIDFFSKSCLKFLNSELLQNTIFSTPKFETSKISSPFITILPIILYQ